MLNNCVEEIKQAVETMVFLSRFFNVLLKEKHKCNKNSVVYVPQLTLRLSRIHHHFYGANNE